MNHKKNHVASPPL